MSSWQLDKYGALRKGKLGNHEHIKVDQQDLSLRSRGWKPWGRLKVQKERPECRETRMSIMGVRGSGCFPQDRVMRAQGWELFLDLSTWWPQ